MCPSLETLPRRRQPPATHPRPIRRHRLRIPRRPSIVANRCLDRDHLLRNDPGLRIEHLAGAKDGDDLLAIECLVFEQRGDECIQLVAMLD